MNTEVSLRNGPIVRHAEEHTVESIESRAGPSRLNQNSLKKHNAREDSGIVLTGPPTINVVRANC